MSGKCRQTRKDLLQNSKSTFKSTMENLHLSSRLPRSESLTTPQKWKSGKPCSGPGKLLYGILLQKLSGPVDTFSSVILLQKTFRSCLHSWNFLLSKQKTVKGNLDTNINNVIMYTGGGKAIRVLLWLKYSDFSVIETIARCVTWNVFTKHFTRF